MRCGLEHRCNQCGGKPCARPVPAGSRPLGLLERSTVATPPLDRLGRSSICLTEDGYRACASNTSTRDLKLWTLARRPTGRHRLPPLGHAHAGGFGQG
eukprot:2204203-Prymnesium_polylepis.1